MCCCFLTRTDCSLCSQRRVLLTLNCYRAFTWKCKTAQTSFISCIADMGRATEQPSLLAIEDSQPQNSKDIIPPMPKRPCPRAETSLSQSTDTEHVHPSSPSCDPTEISRSQSTATEHADPSSPSCDLSGPEQFLDCLES